MSLDKNIPADVSKNNLTSEQKSELSELLNDIGNFLSFAQNEPLTTVKNKFVACQETLSAGALNFPRLWVDQVNIVTAIDAYNTSRARTFGNASYRRAIKRAKTNGASFHCLYKSIRGVSVFGCENWFPFFGVGSP
ncbi:hypothetical protein ACQU0X_25725 [Pseudovibrio ascidiaceicola]|uniref:hypothetical protein n=1 Tax=Pseudovibrio ascidiaceicola TaxID=285279 RepID=UPI003D369653